MVMTAFCLSSSTRSRTTAFSLAFIAGNERLPEQPVPPTHSVDLPEDETLEQPNPGDPGPPVLKPPKKPHLPGQPDPD